MVPPYGYNSRKNTFLPPYSHAVLTSMEYTRTLAAHFEVRARCGMFSGPLETHTIPRARRNAARHFNRKYAKNQGGFAFMKSSYNGQAIPVGGKGIGYSSGELQVPDTPIIPFIEGDGTGRDIWKASRRVFDAAVEHAYGGRRSVAWFEVFVGEKAFNTYKEWLPTETVDAIRDFRVAIKGPLTTPVGGGIRSLNVALRQILDLYSCERPVRYFAGVPSPVKNPEKMDIVIFRENTEDV